VTWASGFLALLALTGSAGVLANRRDRVVVTIVVFTTLTVGVLVGTLAAIDGRL
jgi:hypothetical protein